MVLGERIKRIRTFRNLTQRELGLKLGYEERNADVSIAQYESGYRIPKKDTLMEISRILDVNYINFIAEAPGCAEVPANAMLLMIRLPATMIVMNGPLTPLSVCGLIMVW